MNNPQNMSDKNLFIHLLCIFEVSDTDEAQGPWYSKS